MSDNFSFTEGSGKTGAAKDIGSGVLVPKVIATEIDGSDTGVAAKLGPVTETAPANDTASSGINGRLQRIAQRLTTLIGSTIAVSGTFWQATQPVSGTFWQATQPVSATSLPLPTGAATAAKQPALGTAGSASADVISVQGVASMTALKVDGSGVTQPVSGTVTANAGTNLNTSALALETGGNLATIAIRTPALGQALAAASVPVILPSATITALTPPAAITGFALDATLTGGTQQTKITDGTNVATVKAASTAAVATDKAVVVAISPNNTVPVSLASVPSHAVTNAGTFAVQATLQASSGTDIGKLTANQTVNVAQINGVTPLMGNGVTGTGSQRVTIASDNTAFNVNATTVPATSGGLSTFHLAAAASTNATNIKASAGQLYGYMISNTSAAYTYLCFHNTAGTPTAGASIFFKIGIPAGGAANVEFSNGIAFSTGIAISTVTGAPDSNTTAIALSDQIINLFYK
jgi:hypothetical protein